MEEEEHEHEQEHENTTALRKYSYVVYVEENYNDTYSGGQVIVSALLFVRRKIRFGNRRSSKMCWV